MSDGPHKSLPQKRHWKKVAERAERAAFAPEQVCAELENALRRELQDAPINTVREILQPNPQQSFFSDHSNHSVVALEQLRSKHPGSAVSAALIDAAIAAIRNGLTGSLACQKAIRDTLDTTARSHLRSVEEHYRRNVAWNQAKDLRDRLSTALRLCDHSAITNDLLTTGTNAQLSRPSKCAGVDEGPALP